MIDLQKISIIRDGGTSVWIEPSVKARIKTIEDAKSAQKYYLDFRFGSNTRGQLFDKYPNEPDAQMLDLSNYNFSSEGL